MVNRLKPILLNIISLEQTRFVKGRQILDGIVTIVVAMHSLKEKKIKGMLIKLDLSKAYDRLSWYYLKEVLLSFGFDARWTQWLCSCISTPNYSILLNGAPSQLFNASWGLRQGDPISPFLFIIAIEGLGRLIKAQIANNCLKGLNLWGSKITLSHQQFVDDIMLFCQVSLTNSKSILEILKLFMQASCTMINNEKSNVYFFNTTNATKRFIS